MTARIFVKSLPRPRRVSVSKLLGLHFCLSLNQFFNVKTGLNICGKCAIKML